MTSNPSARRQLWLFLICVSGVLLLLFGKGFNPNFVLASNDGPLGAIHQRAMAYPGAFHSVWYDLNSIGNTGGSSAPILTSLLLWLLGPVLFSKFYVPLVLLFLGSSAWLFFQCLGLSRLACLLGGLAAALNSTSFSTASWGVGSQVICFGWIFLALAAFVSRPRRWPWLKYPLAGMAVGMAVMEGANVGAIYSLCIAAFVVLYPWLAEEGAAFYKSAARSVGRLSVVVLFAAFMAAHSLTVMIGTQIVGVVGMQQDAEAKARKWDEATQWSLPKREVIALFVPGILGYRMDTPLGMPESLKETYKGGSYWGAIGRHPAWDRYFAEGRQGPPPNPNAQYIRFSGGGGYCGVLVLLTALWAALQSFRGRNSALLSSHRKFVWFWLAVSGVGIVLAFGRHFPVFQFLYNLPGGSYSRNPVKFIIWFNWAILVMFAYGVHGLSRRYLETAATNASGIGARLKSWWAKAAAFDKRWVAGCVGAFVLSCLGWLIYSSSRHSLEEYLQAVLFDEPAARAIAAFSIWHVGWFVLFLGASVGLLVLTMIGTFAGKAARWGGILLGLVVVVDLARANLPWIIHWNYKEKYELSGPNPIIQFLREKPYEHRVAILPGWILGAFQVPRQIAELEGQMDGLYGSEWKQQLFQYYNVQSLDVVQMPRIAEDLSNYETALAVRSQETLSKLARRWELTNTRYIIGFAGFLELLNKRFDPGHERFRIVKQFNVLYRPGVVTPTSYADFTAELADPATNGLFAVFEFTGALPRARLYSKWLTPVKDQTIMNELRTARLGADELSFLKANGTNDFLTLNALASPAFDPHQIVLLAASPAIPDAGGATNQNPGTVEFSSYAPTRIVLTAKVETPAVLLLNDKYDPNWRVRVDGKPAELLRCNYIMRGVYLTPGDHTVEFSFHWPAGPMYVSLAAIALGLLTLGVLLTANRRPDPAAESGHKKNRKEPSAARPP